MWSRHCARPAALTETILGNVLDPFLLLSPEAVILHATKSAVSLIGEGVESALDILSTNNAHFIHRDTAAMLG